MAVLLLPNPCGGGVLVPIMGGPGAAAAVRIARRPVDRGGAAVVVVGACAPAAFRVGKHVVHPALILHEDCIARVLGAKSLEVRRRPALLVNEQFPALVLPTCLPAGAIKPTVGCCITDVACFCIATAAGGQ